MRCRLAAIVVVVAACPGDRWPAPLDGTNGDAPVVSVSCVRPAGTATIADCTAYAQARCSRRKTCLGDSTFGRVWTDLASCEATTAAACIDAQASGVGPTATAACITEIETQVCAASITKDALPIACESLDPCVQYAEQAGAPCSATKPCVPGLYCVWQPPYNPTMQVCAPRAGAGTLCRSRNFGERVFAVCDYGLLCIPDDDLSKTGSCRATTKTIGGQCGAASSSPVCDKDYGLSCNYQLQMCE